MDDDFQKGMFRGFSSGFFGSFGQNNVDQDINNMFREMEEMMKHFSFGNFNIIENPQEFNHSIEDNPQIEGPDRDGNLRDKFLKPGSQNDKTQSSDLVPMVPKHAPGHKSFFEQFFNPSINQSNEFKFDEDLDEKVKREGFDRVLREDLLKNSVKNPNNPNPEWNMPNFYSSGQSYSIRRIQRPDGSIEEVKTVKNSDGKEETTITRIIGDKVHSVIEKKSNKGLEETEELFQNFSEENIDDFNKMWDNFPRNDKSHKLTLDQPNVQGDGKSPFSIVSKLFSWFK